MKILITILALALSITAMAQETVLLNGKEFTINGSEALIVRTNQTPKEVKLTFLVPMANSVCEEYQTRPTLVTSGAQCGHDYMMRRVPGPRVCLRMARNGCLAWDQRWVMSRVLVPRSCYIQESYCSHYGTAVSLKSDSMTIQFKKLPALGDSETETFSVKGTQEEYNDNNVIFKIEALSTIGTYKIRKKKTFLGIGNNDDWVITEK